MAPVLPRGGVLVAAGVAKILDAPLDVIVVRKLGVPFQPELGMGAIGEDDVRVINNDVVRQLEISANDIDKVERRERSELERRAERFRPDGVRTPLVGRVVIVDDGIATGSTARAACQVAKAEGALRVILAVPVPPVDCMAIVDGATHLFSEPGTLEQAADLARDWFIEHVIVAPGGMLGLNHIFGMTTKTTVAR
jgi:putative phosphoribosyl transferase